MAKHAVQLDDCFGFRVDCCWVLGIEVKVDAHPPFRDFSIRHGNIS